LVFALSATGICTAKVPDLVGNWTGPHEGFHKGQETVQQPEEGVVSLIIMEQNDRLFTGNLTYKMANGDEGVDGFAGAIGFDNKTLYIAEFGKGFEMGIEVCVVLAARLPIFDPKLRQIDLSII